MSLTLSQISVTTAPALVGVLAPGASFTCQPAGTTPVYLGNSSAVTTASGYGCTGGFPQSFTLPPTSTPATLWVVGSGSTSLGTAFVSAS